MGEQQPQMQVDEKELAVIQRSFKDNDELLQAMRAVMLNINPTESDKELVLSTFSDNDELFKLVYKRFIPTLDRSTPIGQVADVWLGAEQMVFGQSRDVIQQAIEYKEQSINMTKNALESLRDPDVIGADVTFSARKYLNDPLGINLLARNQFIRHVEQQLLFLKLISAQVKADPKVAKKNSVK